MKKIALLIALLALVIVPGILNAETAYWQHSSSTEVFKYRIAWGSTPGNYTFDQEMNRSDCVPGTDALYGGPYDCKMPLVGTFIVGNTYYYVGYGIAYDIDGNEFPSEPTPEKAYIKRPSGTTTGTKPNAMQGLGIYEK